MRKDGGMNGNARRVPVTDNGEIILDSLVVDVCSRLKKGHRHFGVTNPF